MDNIQDIMNLYNNDAADYEETRLDRHQLERDVTWRYLDEFLPARGRILEIGAATGRYTLELARRGYRVTAVDLAEKLLARAREKIAAENLSALVEFHVGDARALALSAEMAFDVVLMMGPIYHLVLKEDRLQALREAYARLKSGGLIFAALVSRLGVLAYLLHKCPDWIENQGGSAVLHRLWVRTGRQT